MVAGILLVGEADTLPAAAAEAADTVQVHPVAADEPVPAPAVPDHVVPALLLHAAPNSRTTRLHATAQNDVRPPASVDSPALSRLAAAGAAAGRTVAVETVRMRLG